MNLFKNLLSLLGLNLGLAKIILEKEAKREILFLYGRHSSNCGESCDGTELKPFDNLPRIIKEAEKLGRSWILQGFPRTKY